MVSPSRRRDAVTYLCRRHRVSERRACQLLGQHRSTQRYVPQPPLLEQRLVERMNELAERHPRYGYRRVWALLRSEGFEVNRKRIERLWRLEGHRVPPQRKSHGQKALGGPGGSTWALQAAKANDVWSYDFVAARTEDGLPLRILNVVDEFTRRCVGCHVDRSIGARGIISELEQLFEQHGKPRLLRSDNGREFIAETLAEWLKDQGVTQVFIEKASPQQNAYVERFNGSMRDELLIDGYNTIRPHRGLGYKTPAAFYATLSDGSR
jgi:putative transposase